MVNYEKRSRVSITQAGAKDLAEEPATSILHYNQTEWKRLEPKIAAESDVTLSVNGETWLSFACTPTDLEALAVGFLYNEGVIQSAAEVISARVCAEGTHIDLWLSHSAAKPAQWRRTSGCTGGATTAQGAPLPKVDFPDSTFISPEQLLDNMDQLFSNQALYHEARGIHCAALSDGQNVCLIAEDIGRHNTLDKLAGLLLLRPLSLEQRVLLTTGRVSSEMLQKAARLGVQVVVSRTSPTLLSVRMAQQAGITLIGYARRAQFNIYTHPQRIAGAPVDN